MGAALVLVFIGLGAMAAGVLIGRYYVPDDRQLRRTARHSKSYVRALSHLIARDHEAAVGELRAIVEENIEDSEPYFALGAMFRSRGEHERAIRVHQSLALRERDKRKLRQRAMFELGLDFRAAGMPRRATRAMEEVLLEEPEHDTALRVLAALYEEQARFNEAAGLWQKIGKLRKEDTGRREHHLLVAAAQAALARDDLDSARQLLKSAQKLEESAHFFAAAAELAAAKGNHRAARDRLKQALVAEPALVPHLLPGLVAAEQELAADESSDGRDDRRASDDLDDEPAAAAELEGGAQKLLAPAGAPPATSASTDAGAGVDAAAAAQTAIGAAATAVAGVVSGTIGGADASTGASATTGAIVPAAAPSGGALVATPSAGAPPSEPPSASGLVAALAARIRRSSTPPPGVPLVAARPVLTIAQRVLAILEEIEAKTGPRLELALIRAQLAPPADAAAAAELARRLVAKFPDALAARVATARLALDAGDAATIRAALEVLVGDDGALAWTMRGRWQCSACGHRPGPFSWRCGQCRRWNTLRMETGIEPPPAPSRERRAAPRPARLEGLLGAAPDHALPAATLDPGLTDDELARAGARPSLLGRVGGWFSGAWRRDRR
jgi:lipopolysaccharide biosynthesis regulator YciM